MRHRTEYVVREAPSGALRRRRERPSLWFCVPAHGRLELAAICLRQLRRTCDALTQVGIDANAVVVADDENLDTAADLGFATVRRDNEFLSRRFNDGLQLACDPAFNPRPADYVVPCGSDDFVDHRLFLNLPGPGEIRGFRLAAFVSEDGTEIASRFIDYDGGVGIRIYRRDMLAHVGYRPADEDRKRACDTSILTNVRQHYRKQGEDVHITYGDLHEWQIVDWKSPDEQLNSFGDITARHRRGTKAQPYRALTGVFPAASLREMRRYHQSLAPVAA